MNVLPEKAHLDTDARGRRSALRSGTPQGGKPADNVLTSLSRTERRATPAIYADERNLCLKRRKLEQVKWLIHLAQKGWCRASLLINQRGVSHMRTRRKAGSYGSLQQVHTELGNSDTALPGNGVRECQHAEQRAEVL